MKVAYNPYGNKHGIPKDDQEAQFFKWARACEMERRKSLPPEEVKALERAENRLARRMNS